MAIPHTITTSDGRRYEVDERGFMNAVSTPQYNEGDRAFLTPEIMRQFNLSHDDTLNTREQTITHSDGSTRQLHPEVFRRLIESISEPGIIRRAADFGASMEDFAVSPRGSRRSGTAAWNYRPVIRGDLPARRKRQQQPKVCLHNACIKCNGKRVDGRGNRCEHGFVCNCIECYSNEISTRWEPDRIVVDEEYFF